MNIELIIGTYAIPLILTCFFFVSMYGGGSHVELKLSEEAKRKLRLKENSIFRKFLPNKPEKVWDFTKSKFRTVKNKDSYTYHRVIPFFVYLIATIIIWILTTINFFVVEFMTKQAYYNIFFIMISLYIFYEVAVLICLNKK